MSLSAIIVTYRTGPILAECLSALLSAGECDEILLVDNGNEPAEELHLNKVALTNSQVRLFRGQGNVGFSAGCNLGARHATGERLLFVNPDVVLAKGAATRMAEAVDQLPSPAIVGGDLRDAQGRPDRGSRRDRVTPWRAFVSFSGLHRLGRWISACRDLHRHEDPVPSETSAVGAVSGALMMVRRSDFAMVGGFDEEYFLHVEDVDLCRRVEEAGGQVVFQPGALGVHARSTSDVPAAWISGHKARSFARYFRKFARSRVDRAVAYVMGGALGVLMPLRAKV
jgi:N-acetylglucosaminyl-diphospho-decaprenol L-rhamnosyltransferase